MTDTITSVTKAAAETLIKNGFSSLMTIVLFVSFLYAGSTIYHDMSDRIEAAEKRYTETILPALTQIEKALDRNTQVIENNTKLLDKVIEKL